MSKFTDLSNDLILEILSHNPLDSISLSQTIPGPFQEHQLLAHCPQRVKWSRNAKIPLACTTDLDLNALAENDPTGLERVARPTCFRERNFASSSPKLMGPASSDLIGANQRRVAVYARSTQFLQSTLIINFMLLYPNDVGRLVVEEFGGLFDGIRIVELTYGSDYQTASMTVVHSFPIRQYRHPSLVIEVSLTPQLCIYRIEFEADNRLGIVVLNLVTGTEKFFHTDIYTKIAQSSCDASKTTFIWFSTSLPVDHNMPTGTLSIPF
ncbi:hypothetical protein C8J56DRAFT_1159748 [Mycena floridula]|nr:hypothetical protein C8J56DRAFT_1159748 [Mycena floridula]